MLKDTLKTDASTLGDHMAPDLIMNININPGPEITLNRLLISGLLICFY